MELITSSMATGKAIVRRYEANRLRKFDKFTNKVVNYVKDKLNIQWSPEQISGRLNRELKVKLSTKNIYSYIYNDKANGGNLYKLLPHRGVNIKVN